MEDIRTYNREEDDWYLPDEERVEYNASSSDDEVPFHIPRD